MSKKKKETLGREERKAKGKAKKAATETKVKTAVASKGPAGLTYAQLEAMNPFKSQKPAPEVSDLTPEVEKDFALALAENLDRNLGITHMLKIETEPVQVQAEVNAEEPAEDDEEFNTAGLRKAVAGEIRRIIEETQALFDGFLDSPEMAEVIAGILFEEGSSLNDHLAEILVSDEPAEAIGDLLKRVGDEVLFLQLVASSAQPEYELDKLEPVDPEVFHYLKEKASSEAALLNLKQRFEEIQLGEGIIDPGIAQLIRESEETAEAERQRRNQFRRQLTSGLHKRKEREGRRFSDSPEESGDEEFIRFLMENRGDLQAVRQNLPPHLREQLQMLLFDEEQRAPVLKLVARFTARAKRQWEDLQARLSSGANRPEETVSVCLPTIRQLQNILGEIRGLNTKLQNLEPRKEIHKRDSKDWQKWSRSPNWNLNPMMFLAFDSIR